MRLINCSALLAATSLASLHTACLRSYNTSPVSAVTLGGPASAPEGLELKSHPFLSPSEIQDKFGTKLAKERRAIPVQVSIRNKGTQTYKVTRVGFGLMDKTGTKVEALTLEQAYQLGRHGWGTPICGLFFGGFLGIPSALTTSQANEQLQADYRAKMLNDTLLEPGKEASGVLFFTPNTKRIERNENYKLVVEVENAATGAKTSLQQPLN